MDSTAHLILETGEIFEGVSIGHPGKCIAEIVFNTAMTGYQEIITDPSYSSQIINFTYPHIGNTGINLDDSESIISTCCGVILREQPTLPSSWRSTASFTEFLKEKRIVGIAEIDTRYLTHLLRARGCMTGCIISGNRVNQFNDEEFDRCKKVDIEAINDLSIQNGKTEYGRSNECHVVIYDFGVKKSILTKFIERDCRVTVVPAGSSIQNVISMNPSGIVLSNGPGDPRDFNELITLAKGLLRSRIPLLGICLGHQLIALACGANVKKMKFGHHGVNHPVQCTQSKKVFITSQNHNYVVDDVELPDNLRVTYRSLFDNSIQGLKCLDAPVISFQGHPEGGAGPSDIGVIFDNFLDLISAQRSALSRVAYA